MSVWKGQEGFFFRDYRLNKHANAATDMLEHDFFFCWSFLFSNIFFIKWIVHTQLKLCYYLLTCFYLVFFLFFFFFCESVNYMFGWISKWLFSIQQKWMVYCQALTKKNKKIIKILYKSSSTRKTREIKWCNKACIYWQLSKHYKVLWRRPRP